MHETVITDFDLITPFGKGLDSQWKALCSKRSKISQVKRFDVSNFPVKIAALIEDIPEPGNSESLLFQILKRLKPENNDIPCDCPVLFATAKGEIDLLEKEIENTKNRTFKPSQTLKKLKEMFGFSHDPVLISAACASSTIAIAEASRMIRLGISESVIVAGADIITEFVFSGFSSLLALDLNPAAPFDINRKGLSLGEAASYMILMSEEAAEKKGIKPRAKISGWGSSNDANHATGPSRTGDGLISAVNISLKRAGILPDEIGVICGHGTGTVYNDLMEINAFKNVFNKHPVPLFSAKGALGHTMGACGIIEVILTIKALEEQIVPPTVNLTEPAPEMEGWASSEKQKINKGYALTTNSGFGGINAALVVSLI